MAGWSVYGVFVGSRFGLTTNRRVALRAAREHRGEVRRVPYRDSPRSFDAPTFRVLSDPVADFRPAGWPRQAFLADLARSIESTLLFNVEREGVGARIDRRAQERLATPAGTRAFFATPASPAAYHAGEGEGP